MVWEESGEQQMERDQDPGHDGEELLCPKHASSLLALLI